MKAVLTGILVMVAIAIITWLVMGATMESSQEVYVSPNGSVRLDN